jgi:hypothetical protein
MKLQGNPGMADVLLGGLEAFPEGAAYKAAARLDQIPQAEEIVQQAREAARQQRIDELATHQVEAAQFGQWGRPRTRHGRLVTD